MILRRQLSAVSGGGTLATITFLVKAEGTPFWNFMKPSHVLSLTMWNARASIRMKIEKDIRQSWDAKIH